VQRAVCERIMAWMDGQPGWTVVGITESPIQGADGNREFLLCARRGGARRRGETAMAK
jgi:23S rRNA (cytidine1920-2'-O)/16S rRNA (cytidine1409-2'-O)-methyltransferase